MILKAIKAISFSFSKELKLKYLGVIIFNIFSGLLEVLSIAFIIPFTMLLFKKDELLNNQIVNDIYNYIGFASYESFIIFFSIFFLIILILSNICSIINVWLISFLTYKLDYNLISRLFKNFIFLGYENKINVNSSDLISKMTIQIKRFVEGVVNSVMIIFQKLITILFIIIFLAYIDFKITISTLCLLLILYLIFYKIINKTVHSKGSEMTMIFNNRQRLISESIFGIKEVILYDLQQNLYKKLSALSKKLTLNVSFVRTAAVTPRYLLEILIFIMIIPLSLYFFLYENQNLDTIFPTLTAFIFALYKISPAVQAIFAALVNIKTDYSAFDIFKNDIKMYEKTTGRIFNYESKKINFQKNIIFKDIDFAYKQSIRKNILESVNFEIKKNEVIGIFGQSGSGKTSCLNLLLGFLKPTSGFISIDNNPQQLFNNSQWMKKIGYVSQFTFLFDDTLLNNITMFEKNPDRNKVIDSLFKSGLEKYFKKNNENLDLIIGEKGSKISGGEAQRLGLARAIYRNPEILILDEFTSSLDAYTEEEIIRNLQKLKDNITIILSSHKYSVLQFCDRLYEINNGKLKKISNEL